MYATNNVVAMLPAIIGALLFSHNVFTSMGFGRFSDAVDVAFENRVMQKMKMVKSFKLFLNGVIIFSPVIRIFVPELL